jgi:hypothetical protein
VVTRSQIAAALSTVPGVTGEPLEPPTKGAGQAWPVWRDSVVQGGCDVFQVNWYVYVVLPNGDMNAPADAADPLVVPLAQAIHSTGLTVERWEPFQLVMGPDNTIPVLRYSAFD